MTEHQGSTVELTASATRASRNDLHRQTLEDLREAWLQHQADLPGDFSTWPRGAAYVRESSAKSMVGDAPTSQLRWILQNLTRRRVWVDWADVYFDNASGTSTDHRPSFQRMRDAALRERYTVICAHQSDRLFRNASDAKAFSKEMRLRGVEIDSRDAIKGDHRSAAIWISDYTQLGSNEAWARRTSENVGQQLEQLSATGTPLGRLPEGYVIARRGPSFHGKVGRILEYGRNEPLASVIVAGKDRYLAGSTLADLAAWCLGTELGGKTPNGADMNWEWWRGTLLNPKYAGYHMPAKYQGFRPGLESPKRPRRVNGVTPLVPCNLPPLWSLDEWEQMLALGKARHSGGKNRKTYTWNLLSALVYDERCGHRMAVQHRRRGRFFLLCGKVDATGRHSGQIRGDLIEAAIDAYFGSLTFSDGDFLLRVEQELEHLDGLAPDTVAPAIDPGVTKLESTLRELRDVLSPDARQSILKELDRLQVEAARRRDEAAPSRSAFKAAVGDLAHWGRIWGTAPAQQKNELLKSIGLRVTINRADDGSAFITSMEVSDQVFALALGTTTSQVALPGPRGLEPGNAPTLLALEPALRRAVERARVAPLKDAA